MSEAHVFLVSYALEAKLRWGDPHRVAAAKLTGCERQERDPRRLMVTLE